MLRRGECYRILEIRELTTSIILRTERKEGHQKPKAHIETKANVCNDYVTSQYKNLQWLITNKERPDSLA